MQFRGQVIIDVGIRLRIMLLECGFQYFKDSSRLCGFILLARFRIG